MIVLGLELFIAAKINGSIDYNSGQTEKVESCEHSSETIDGQKLGPGHFNSLKVVLGAGTVIFGKVVLDFSHGSGGLKLSNGNGCCVSNQSNKGSDFIMKD